MKAIRSIVTLPRIAVLVVILCLLFQIQKGKSVEMPKYATPDFVASSIFERVNEHRMSIKVQPLSLDESLNAEAQRYCETVAKGNLQASLASATAINCGFTQDDVTAYDRVKGVRRNVAMFTCEKGSPALNAVRQWIEHQEEVTNLENDGFVSTGVGVVRRGNTYYVCQIFGGNTAKIGNMKRSASK